jgi:hypothetical protein
MSPPAMRATTLRGAVRASKQASQGCRQRRLANQHGASSSPLSTGLTTGVDHDPWCARHRERCGHVVIEAAGPDSRPASLHPDPAFRHVKRYGQPASRNPREAEPLIRLSMEGLNQMETLLYRATRLPFAPVAKRAMQWCRRSQRVCHVAADVHVIPGPSRSSSSRSSISDLLILNHSHLDTLKFSASPRQPQSWQAGESSLTSPSTSQMAITVSRTAGTPLLSAPLR